MQGINSPPPAKEGKGSMVFLAFNTLVALLVFIFGIVGFTVKDVIANGTSPDGSSASVTYRYPPPGGASGMGFWAGLFYLAVATMTLSMALLPKPKLYLPSLVGSGLTTFWIILGFALMSKYIKKVHSDVLADIQKLAPNLNLTEVNVTGALDGFILVFILGFLVNTTTIALLLVQRQRYQNGINHPITMGNRDQTGFQTMA